MITCDKARDIMTFMIFHAPDMKSDLGFETVEEKLLMHLRDCRKCEDIGDEIKKEIEKESEKFDATLNKTN